MRIDLGTPHLDALRASDFARLEKGGHCYFDYTGAGLYAERQVIRQAERLLRGTWGNPHSYNPTSTPATDEVEHARSRVLAWFGGTGTHECIFTANATAALHLVGESYDFAAHPELLLAVDNHNSVNGIREYARRAGARVRLAPLESPSLRLDLPATLARLEGVGGGGGLFAFPAQSNYSGVQHPLDLVDLARERGWTVLLDAAAFVPSNRLDLAEVQADFVAVSFYKMFGHPTGVGALLARREALSELRRPWFAGGTVGIVSVVADDHRLVPGHAGFEDGTPNFLSIPAVADGLQLLEEVGIDEVHERVTRATEVLLDEMAALRHPNGAPVVAVIGPTTLGLRGGTIAFNVVDPQGSMFHDRLVQERAAELGISLRSGCFCNPGAGEVARGFTRAEMAPLFERSDAPDFCDIDDHFWATLGRGASALRASVGWVTNSADLEVLVDFLGGFAGRSESEMGAPSPESRGTGPDSP